MLTATGVGVSPIFVQTTKVLSTLGSQVFDDYFTSQYNRICYALFVTNTSKIKCCAILDYSTHILAYTLT